MVEKEKIEDALTYNIIGCAMKVHAALGNGFQEVIYQRALAIEMRKAGILFARELEMQIFYDGEGMGTRSFGGKSLGLKRLRHPKNKLRQTI